MADDLARMANQLQEASPAVAEGLDGRRGEVGTFWKRKAAMIDHALPSMGKVASKIVHVLEKDADSTTGKVTIGTEDLARKVGSDRKAVREALRELATAGVLRVEEEGGGHGQKKRFQLVVASSNNWGYQAPDREQPAADATGALIPSSGGPTPRVLGPHAPTYLCSSASSSQSCPPPRPSAPSSKKEHQAEYRSRVAVLVERGIYKNQALRFAKAFTMGEILDHWRWVTNEPRIRKRSAAFACRLKEHLPEESTS